MFLADKASDDGSGIWCSKGTIQRHTELGETTVKRAVRAFLKEGILIETGSRTCKNGFTVVYRIDLAKVEALEPTLEPEIETGSTVAPVQSGPGTGAAVAGVPGPPRPPNHPKTIHKPPTRKREAADEEAEKILAAYPADRLRGKAVCLAQIEEAMKDGIAPGELLQAVQAYATDSAGFTRSKVCFSDNWLQRWSREFGPVVKVDQLVREMIQNDETKEPFVPLPGSLLFANDERGRLVSWWWSAIF
jgi:hypothetical protein